MEQVIHTIPSKRNHLSLLEQDGRSIIRKCFANRADLERELAVYRKLAASRVPHANLIEVSQQVMYLCFLPGIPFSELLEAQSREGTLDITHWYKLIHWVVTFHRETGLAQKDCNLGNYLYDQRSDTVFGVDFESCEHGTAEQMIGQICAHILINKPETGHKIVRAVYAHCNELDLDSNSISANVCEYTRKLQIQRRVAAVIVAPETFSGPEQDNALRPIDENDLFHPLLQRLRNLGIAEIYTSGFAVNEPGVVNCHDTFEGIQPILDTIHKQNLLIVRLDAPLFDTDMISTMLGSQVAVPSSQVTILCQGEKYDPLIVMYSRT